MSEHLPSSTLRRMAARPAAFREGVFIAADAGAKPFRPDAWQDADFRAMDPAWLAIAGTASSNTIRRAWLERPRGHSKTTDLALSVCWPLLFSRRAVSGICAAGDQDQARILRDDIAALARCNQFMQEFLTIDKWCVTNKRTGSRLDVISADAATSYGQLVDYIVADEVAHWRSDELWLSLLSTAAKRSHCVLMCISNAGWTDTWQYRLREAVRTDPDWYFSRLDGPQASWLSAKVLDEQRRLLPPTAYARLWLNEWASGSGDALQADDITAAIRAEGPMDGTEDGYTFIAGLDIGISQDATALVVIGKRGQRYRLAHVRLWRPAKGRRVDLGEVEAACLAVQQRYRLRCLAYDPFQAEFLTSRLFRAGVLTRQVTFSGSNLTAMATVVLDAFTSGSIDLFPQADLVADLQRLRIVEKSYGMRLESPRGPSGHGDAATGLALALLAGKSVYGCDVDSDPDNCFAVGRIPDSWFRASRR